MGKLNKFDYVIIGLILLLAVIPIDPTDAIDGGTPIVEALLGFGYWFIRTRMGGKK